MRPGEAVMKLATLGYRFEVAGDRLRWQFEGEPKPDRRQVQRLLEVVKAHKNEVLAYLKSLVLCQDCVHVEVGDGWALCQVDPWDGIRGQDPDYPHPCKSFANRTKPPPPAERILSCRECPWYAENPWTHYPELPAWCHYHMDNLAADNPACIGYRRGDVPQKEKVNRLKN